MDYQDYTKIGIIGPRSYMLGGHDYNNELRISLRSKFTNILNNLSNQKIPLLGFTGLGLGCEQDFAIACFERNIEYIGMLPFQKQEAAWKDLPIVQKVYKELIDNSKHYIVLEDGGYSPKKILNKYKKIIEISDIIILVQTKKYLTSRSVLDCLNNKTLIIIDV